jgi:hypothetical protein
MLVFVMVLFFPQSGFALLDFVGEQAKKATEVAAYADAVADLSSELSPDEDLKTGAVDIRKHSDAAMAQSSKLRYLSRTTKSVLSGPEWSSRRLETNIRSTTEYVRRVKRLAGRVAILGTEGAVALNTTETNLALNEVQKNQQTLILQNEDAKLREIEREQEQARQWNEFSDRQRKIRRNEVTSGKLW